VPGITKGPSLGLDGSWEEHGEVHKHLVIKLSRSIPFLFSSSFFFLCILRTFLILVPVPSALCGCACPAATHTRRRGIVLLA